MFVLSLALFCNPSFADDDKKEKKEKTEKSKSKTLDKNPGSTKTKNSKKSTTKSNDANINTIKPGGLKTPKEVHKKTTSGTTISKDGPTEDRARGERTRTSVGTPAKNPTRRKRRRSSRSGKATSTNAAAAGITAAAVGMAAMALIPTKTKAIKCPFNKARVGFRGGAQLSRPEEGAFGGGMAVGYRWCNPFAVDLSYAHYGDLEPNFNAPIQGSVQMFIFNSIVSGYVSGGVSVAHQQGEETEWLYGPHGGIGAQILFKNGNNLGALNLEGRYTQYSNDGIKPQENQIHAMLGLDFYF